MKKLGAFLLVSALSAFGSAGGTTWFGEVGKLAGTFLTSPALAQAPIGTPGVGADGSPATGGMGRPSPAAGREIARLNAYSAYASAQPGFTSPGLSGTPAATGASAIT